jgi:hypothetical protein
MLVANNRKLHKSDRKNNICVGDLIERAIEESIATGRDRPSG